MKKIILLLLTFNIIVISGCIGSNDEKPTNQNTAQSGIDCGVIKNQMAKDRCYLSQAIQKSDPEMCDLMVGSKDKCYNSVSVKNHDTTLCDKVTGSYKIACFWNAAYSKKDASLCDRLDVETTHSIEKQNCQESAKGILGKLSYCENKDTQDQKDICYGRSMAIIHAAVA